MSADGPVNDAAIWGLKEIIYIFAFRAIFGYVAARLAGPYTGELTGVVVTLADRTLTIILIYLIVRRLTEGWQQALGLKTGGLARQIVIGLAAGVGLLAALSIGEKVLYRFLAVELQTHPLIGSAFGAGSFSQFLWPLLAGGIFTPVAEEMLYRGMIYPAAARRAGVAAGVVISVIVFTVFHFNLYWLGEIFFAGLVFTLLYIKTRSIIPGIIAHAAVNSWRLIMAFLA